MTVSAIAIATPALAADLYTPAYVPPANDPVYSPEPMVVGHLSMGLGIVNFDGGLFDSSDDNVGIFTGAGRANINLGGAWNVELETGGSALFKDGSSYSSVGVAGHVWTKLNSAAFGAYGGVNFPTGATVYTLGLEGETYLGNLTLGANADYNWVDTGGGSGDFWDLAAWADVYFTPDFRLGGALGYASGDIPDTWSATLDTEYRFSGTPFSGWAEASYASADGGADVWGGMLGVRVFMDPAGTTLQQHDRDVPWEGLLSTRLDF